MAVEDATVDFLFSYFAATFISDIFVSVSLRDVKVTEATIQGELYVTRDRMTNVAVCSDIGERETDLFCQTMGFNNSKVANFF
jgi:hypothetical protein